MSNNVALDPDYEDHDQVQRDAASMKAMRPIPRISIQAFCETEGIANPIERAAEDRRMAKAHLKVHMGRIATAIEFYRSAPTPNLIILESRQEPNALLQALRQLAEFCDPTTKVVVIGHYNDVGLYRDLVRSGAAGAVFGDVRRGKALTLVMERVKIMDSAGNPISLDAVREVTEHNH